MTANHEPSAKIELLERRCHRERTSRFQAEALLEEKSRELYQANQTLMQVNASLEQTIADRTRELKRALEKARKVTTHSTHLALHDPLTRLPNRRFLRQRLDDMVTAAHRDGTGLAILHIDLDRFKQINDTLGHAAGDFVLVHASECLRELSGPQAFVSRIGGDEFVVAISFKENYANASDLANRLINRLKRPVVFENRRIRFGASVGMAYASGDNVDPGQLLVNADIALYQAKSRGRGVVAYFTSELEAETIARKETADGIIEGLERGEFIPYYQPRLNAHDHSVESVEVLARWEHPTKGLLSPADFLQVAEDIGTVAQIDKAILEAALADRHSWARIIDEPPPISVNVSYRRLKEPDLLKGLKKLNIPAGAVRFEMLESIVLDDADDTILDRIEAIKDLGIEIEIDDFGSGHASIISVLRLRPARLKIDRQLVASSTTSKSFARIVGAIVDIGSALGVDVVAEGVETMEHAELCTTLGCASLQGYAFARPMPNRAIQRYLRNKALASAAE